jgi:hypothetical protein
MMTSLDHVQLAMPGGREPEARAFYQGIPGIPETPKPAGLNERGGCNELAGYHRIYVDDPFGNRIELMEVKSDPRG